jgi:phosphoglucosamine mutase
MGRLFGTDGVRGLAGEQLSGDLAYRLGQAVVRVLVQDGTARPRILIGRDTRASGEFLEAALAAGVCSAGGDAVLLGVIPTPAVALLTPEIGVSAGAVISASHNPAADNGIKFFAENGMKLPDAVEDRVESFLDVPAQPVSGRGIGRIAGVQDAGERYLTRLVRDAGGGAPLDGMRVVVDCANGAAWWAAPELLRRLGARVTAIHDEPDGWNINDGCGATHPDVVAGVVAEVEADAGVSHDGDADRALFSDERGRVVDGDQVLAACALDLDSRGALEGRLVVTTVMANLGFHHAMRRAGISVSQTSVGDRYVLEELERTGAVLGGEQSGHVIFRRHATTGDGLLTAVKFLSLARARGVPVSEVAASMERFPQVLLNVPVLERDRLDQAAPVWEAVQRAERALGEAGRVLVRASGTEPLVRVMVEAATEDEARTHAEAIAEAVRASLAST